LERQFTSTHSCVPGHWSEIWKKTKSENPEDYPLEWNGCTYTTAARRAFLQITPSHQPADIWPMDELNRVGEYEGVSAFNDIQQALVYGEGAPGKQYVVFDAEPLFKLPEDGGYAVKVTSELVPPMSRESFLRWISEGCRTQAG